MMPSDRRAAHVAATVLGALAVLATTVLVFAAIWAHDSDVRSRLTATAIATGVIAYLAISGAFLLSGD